MSVITTTSTEIDNLLDWLKKEIAKTEYGEVGLKFKIHQSQVVAIEKTTSIKGRFDLRFEGT